MTIICKDLNNGISVHEMEVLGLDGTWVPIALYSSGDHQYSEDSTSLDDPWPVFVHFHGGGFMFGTTKSETAVCRRIARELRILVIDVHYQYTPQRHWPAAVFDAGTVVAWIFDYAKELHCNLQEIVLGGVGSGARCEQFPYCLSSYVFP
jgi:acetyl esterase/lipase